MRRPFVAITLIVLAACALQAPPQASVPPDYIVLQSMSGERILDLRGLDVSTASMPPDRDVIFVATNDAGRAALREWSVRHIDEKLTIAVDGHVISTLVVKTIDDDVILIDGGFSRADAEAVLAKIRRGGA